MAMKEKIRKRGNMIQKKNMKERKKDSEEKRIDR
jgi:hypothetical protein